MTQQLHCVVYRRGGTHNFTWHRSLACTHAETVEKRDLMRQAGYPAVYVVNYAQSLSIGLPETFEGPAAGGSRR